MTDGAFDEYAEQYDSWFLENRNVLQSEVLLIKKALGNPGNALSVGCGSGIFELLLRKDHGIHILNGVDPSDDMARIAEQRGMVVKRGKAERLPFGDAQFDTVLFNGSPSYIEDLEAAFLEATRVLRLGGWIVVADVPAESSYGLLYRTAAKVGTWDDPFLRSVAPEHPYPIPFAAAAEWRTTEEKTAMLEEAGFVEFEYFQTLTRHAKYSDEAVEEPVRGYERGDYVAIRGRKP